jgi:hypothetical protein
VPKLRTWVPIEEVMAEEYKQQLRLKMQDYTRQKEDEYRKKDEEFAIKEQQQQQSFEQRLAGEKKALQLTLEENLRKSIASDFENQLLILQNSVNASAEKLKESRQKELEFMQREQSLKQKKKSWKLPCNVNCRSNEPNLPNRYVSRKPKNIA